MGKTDRSSQAGTGQAWARPTHLLPIMVSSGYPGGCATPRWQLMAISSPESPPSTRMALVLAYVSSASPPTRAARAASSAIDVEEFLVTRRLMFCVHVGTPGCLKLTVLE
jgi:hypothetical protein